MCCRRSSTASSTRPPCIKPRFDENGLLKIAGTACTTQYTPDPKNPANAEYLRRWLYPEVLVRNTIQRYWQQGMIGSQNLTGPDADLGNRFLNGQAVNLKLPDLTKIEQDAPAGAVWCTYQDNKQVCGRSDKPGPPGNVVDATEAGYRSAVEDAGDEIYPYIQGRAGNRTAAGFSALAAVGGRRAVPRRRLHRRPDRPAAAPTGPGRRPVRRHRDDGPPAPGPPGPQCDRRQPARRADVQRGRRTHDVPVHGHAQPHHHRRDPARPDRRGDHPRPGVAAGVAADPPDQTHHRHAVLRRHRQPAPALRAAAPGDGRPGTAHSTAPLAPRPQSPGQRPAGEPDRTGHADRTGPAEPPRTGHRRPTPQHHTAAEQARTNATGTVPRTGARRARYHAHPVPGTAVRCPSPG